MADPLAGSRYHLIRRLAVGGMGEVLLAESEGDDRLGLGPGLVVIKRTLPKHPNKAHQNDMLREEGRVALRLRHENLVETFGIDMVDGDPILIMEFLAGRSMAQVLGSAKRTKQMLPVDVALKIVHAAACGLHFAHTLRDGHRPLGLVHRDVSPANIFVTYDGRVKVIDFGVAKADDSEIKTSTGVLKGKIGYMSPEHTRGEVLDPRADLWSLGVLLWESLVADRLFSNQNPAITLHKINEGNVPPPSSRRDDIPASVDGLVAHLLERKRERRVASGRHLVELIEAIADVPWRDADLEVFLRGRFPADHEKGLQEAQRAARTRGEPTPRGLIEVDKMSEADLEAATVVADRKDLVALAKSIASDEAGEDDLRTVQMSHEDVRRMIEGDLTEEPQLAGLSDDDDNRTIPLIRPEISATQKHPPALISDEGADTLMAPMPLDVPSTGAETAPGRPVPKEVARPPVVAPAESSAPSRPVRRRRRRRGPSSLSVAAGTFGVFAVAIGMVFSLYAENTRTEPLVCIYTGPQDADVFTSCVDAPAELMAQGAVHRVDFGQDKGVPVHHGAVRANVPADQLLERLAAAGIVERALLPYTAKERRDAMLSPAIVALGLLALAFAIPGFMFRGATSVVLRVLLLVAALGASVFGAQQGALTWPGLTKLAKRPLVLDASAIMPPAPEKKP